MAGERISAQAMLGEAFAAIRREWEPFILLCGLFALLTILMLWPLLEIYGIILTGDLSSDETEIFVLDELRRNVPYLLIVTLPYSLVSYGLMMVWSRITILGRGASLTGGFPAFFKRILWSFWRYLCAVGWMILFGVAFGVVIGLVFGFSGVPITGGEPGTPPAWALALIIPLYLAIIVFIFGIVVLLGVSLHGEARDFHLPIHHSFKAMGGNLLRALGLLTLVIFVLELIIGIAFVAFLAVLIQASGWAMLLALFLLFWGATAVQLLWISYGAAYATSAVPELKP